MQLVNCLGMCSIAYEPCDENSFKIGPPLPESKYSPSVVEFISREEEIHRPGINLFTEQKFILFQTMSADPETVKMTVR